MSLVGSRKLHAPNLIRAGDGSGVAGGGTDTNHLLPRIFACLQLSVFVLTIVALSIDTWTTAEVGKETVSDTSKIA